MPSTSRFPIIALFRIVLVLQLSVVIAGRLSADEIDDMIAQNGLPADINAQDYRIIVEAQIEMSQASVLPSAERIHTVVSAALDRVKTDEARASLWEVKAFYFESSGLSAEAVGCLRMIVENYPDTRPYRQALSRYAVLELRDGHAGQVLEMLSAVDEEDIAKDPEMLRAKVSALYQTGMKNVARDLILQRIAANPAGANAMHPILAELAVLAFQEGDAAASFRLWEALYDKTKPSERSQELLGNFAAAAGASGRADRAISIHEEALAAYANDERSVAHQYSAGILLFDAGEHERAEQYLQAVLASKASLEHMQDVQDHARRVLALIKARRGDHSDSMLASSAFDERSSPERAQDKFWRWCLLAVNAALLIAVAVVWMIRRKSA